MVRENSYGITWNNISKQLFLKALKNIYFQNVHINVTLENHFRVNNYSLNLNKTLIPDSIMYRCKNLKENYLKNFSKTRNARIILPKMKRAMCDKNSCVKATKAFDSSPKELKRLNLNKENRRNKLKNFC